MNVNDMGLDELRSAVQELQRYVGGCRHLDNENRRLLAKAANLETENQTLLVRVENRDNEIRQLKADLHAAWLRQGGG